MNFTKYILLLALSFILINNTNAQKIKSKTINSGFVFIDGKYIEPPYVVKIKGNKILINGIIAEELTKQKKQKKKTKIDISKLPDFPRDRDYTKESVINYKNPKTGNLLISEVVTYYMDNFPVDSAKKLIYNYIQRLPGLDTVYLNNNGRIMIQQAGRSRPVLFGWHTSYLDNKKTKYEQKHNGKITIFNNIIDDITRNKVLIFNNKERYYFGIYTKRKSYIFLTKVISILNNESFTYDEKYYKIKDLGFELDNFIINEGLLINKNFEERLKKLKIEKDKTYNTTKSFSSNGIVKMWNENVVYEIIH